MSGVFLSICVPTYNRLPYLGPLLKSIASQWEDGVEVCISDNASTDGTTEWLDAQKAERPWLRWEGRGTNVGADRNFLFAAGMGHGEYIWIVGSDDALAPGALAQVLRSLRAKGPDILVMERILCDAELRPVEDQPVWRFDEPEREIHLEREAAIRWLLANSFNTLSLFSFLSSIVFRRDLYETTTVWREVVRMAYPHVYMLMAALDEERTVLASKLRPIYARLGNDSFRTGDLTRRLDLDYKAYTVFLQKLLPEGSPAHREMLDMLRQCHVPQTPMKALAARSTMSPEDWRLFVAWCAERYGPSSALATVSAIPGPLVGAATKAQALRRKLRGGG